LATVDWQSLFGDHYLAIIAAPLISDNSTQYCCHGMATPASPTRKKKPAAV
jgi:hypothetical protein